MSNQVICSPNGIRTRAATLRGWCQSPFTPERGVFWQVIGLPATPSRAKRDDGVMMAMASRVATVRSTLTRMDLTAVIDTRPGVRSGKPCFIGTRIAVYDVLDYLASGMTAEEIVADFPELTVRHVRAAIEFAAVRERRLAAPA